MKLTCYNDKIAENAFSEIREMLKSGKAVNLEYEVAKKQQTKAQMGFVWGALISQIQAYLVGLGLNLEEEDVKIMLYDKVADIVPEMVIDSSVLKLKRDYVKTMSRMDRELTSKFIDGIFTVIDTDPLFSGLKLTPDVRYNWVMHVTQEDLNELSRYGDKLPDRDPAYLNYIRSQPCIICGLQKRSHAHHVKIGRLIGIGLKPEDFRAIPLCPEHHLEGAHKYGNAWLEENLKFITSRFSIDEFTRLCYCRYAFK